MLIKRFLAGREVTRAAIYLGLIIVLLLLPLATANPFYLHVLILVYTFTIASCSLRLIATSGQISLGHAGFMSIGAYVSGLTAKILGWTPWLTMPLGALVTLVIALIVGIPFARVRGIYFIMVSLFFGIGILYVNQAFGVFTGGPSGTGGIPPLFASKVPYYYFFLILTIVSLLILHRLEFSRIGVTWKAIAQSYSVASSVGINEAGHRILALAIGSFFVGIAGAGYAHYLTIVNPNAFGFQQSINFAVYMLVGGINHFAGPIAGTAILVIIPEIFRGLKDYAPYLYSAILIVVLFGMPQGLAGLPGQIRSWVTRRREKKAVTHAS